MSDPSGPPTATTTERPSTLTLTLVRHGESTDNLKSIWAGHRDASLSNYGYSQAKRLDLKRAHLTATEIHVQNFANKAAQASGLPARPLELIVDARLREQNFGEAEGRPWNSKEYTAKDFYSERAKRFDGGESIEDVYRRAQAFVETELVPRWAALATEPGCADDQGGIHICIVSHGIFLAELIAALNAIAGHPRPRHVSLTNTGWTRVKLQTTFAGPPSGSDELRPCSDVRLVPVISNEVSHLAGLQRQSGGIGSAAYDPKQASLTSFFGGSANQTPEIVPDT